MVVMRSIYGAAPAHARRMRLLGGMRGGSGRHLKTEPKKKRRGKGDLGEECREERHSQGELSAGFRGGPLRGRGAGPLSAEVRQRRAGGGELGLGRILHRMRVRGRVSGGDGVCRPR